jgi:FMN phosphatase YigB (HAD superfamily)
MVHTASGVRAVCFDLFGTLMQYGRRIERNAAEGVEQAEGAESGESVFKSVQRWVNTVDPALGGDFARVVMTETISSRVDDYWPALAKRFAVTPSSTQLAAWRERLEGECRRVALFDDVRAALKALQARGLAIAVCSNLAMPFALAARRVLREVEDAAGLAIQAEVMSCEVGSIKSELAIYEAAVTALGVSECRIVFVCDRLIEDVHGPRRVGMRSVWLERVQSADVNV